MIIDLRHCNIECKASVIHSMDLQMEHCYKCRPQFLTSSNHKKQKKKFDKEI